MLLEKGEEYDKFGLMDNLTMSAQLRKMQNKFGLPQHQAKILEQFKGMSERG